MTIHRQRFNSVYDVTRLGRRGKYHIVVLVPASGRWRTICDARYVDAIQDDPDAPGVTDLWQHPDGCRRCVRGAEARGISRPVP